MIKNRRFYYYGDGENINSGVIDGDTELTLEETVGIMNELNSEIHRLKRQINNLENIRNFCTESCERLEKEIKQLKQKNEILIQTIERLCEAW